MLGSDLTDAIQTLRAHGWLLGDCLLLDGADATTEAATRAELDELTASLRTLADELVAAGGERAVSGWPAAAGLGISDAVTPPLGHERDSSR